ncbi:uncharacterized protein cubi_03620 [Cryptosporidium ubiquitum]|uniref:Transmembrane protein n=1 Tax=Cryptosporidium ubiquitum TaxID=857276 RepID=A0A1J4MIH1_9CRYT|nr:uncharacterized protein cubi_03620 [Cryptosporidium ubiquitum]OII73823.1 hypothetical protein cubi_03620 [Cryptosporidium ubiquitum]
MQINTRGCLRIRSFIFILVISICVLSLDAAKKVIEDYNDDTNQKDESLGLSGSQQTESSQDESFALFETYTKSLKFVLEGMFGPEYAQTISNTKNSEGLPLCRENEQMVNKGCNVMIYSCSKHTNGKFSCYFYYWSFCQCSRPWKLKFLNYIIPPLYDCYPSVASEEDFNLALAFQNEDRIFSEKVFSKLSEDLEIPVGKCSTNVIFIIWILLVASFFTWIIYRIYKFGCYIKNQIALSNRKRR